MASDGRYAEEAVITAPEALQVEVVSAALDSNLRSCLRLDDLEDWSSTIPSYPGPRAERVQAASRLGAKGPLKPCSAAGEAAISITMPTALAWKTHAENCQ